MSHYDFFKARFGQQWYLEHFAQFQPILNDGLSFLAEENKRRTASGQEEISLECNLGGAQYNCDYTMPNVFFLKYAIELGIPIALGSDAHFASEVGRFIETALKDLQGMGLKEFSYYKQKKRCTYSVEEAIQSFTAVDQKEEAQKFKAKFPRDAKPKYI